MLSLKTKVILLLFNIGCILTTKKKVENLFGDLYKHDIYAGYLQTDIEGNDLFYVFTPSQNNPSTDPVLLWLNGGPGCSSLFGWLGEVGPVVTELYSNEWTLNEYSWNKNLSVVYVESPAGVGFSRTYDMFQEWTEEKTAKGLLYAMKHFFYDEFPEYSKLPFYVSGESYAGVYIPNFIRVVEKDEDTERIINLRGGLIGNGLTDFEEDDNSCIVEFVYGHALISKETWNAFQRHCYHKEPEVRQEKEVGDFPVHNVTHKCNEIREEINKCLEGLDIYGILRPCKQYEDKKSYRDLFSYRETVDRMMSDVRKIRKERRKEQKKLNNEEPNWGDEDEEEIGISSNGCQDDFFVDDFLNNKTIREKLGVDADFGTWTQCSFVRYPLSDTIDFYQYEIPLLHNRRVWFFSGDLDGRLPTLGALRWLKKLPYGITEEWRQWKVGKQVGGFIQKYENDFAFLTVTGAGHMVPQDARKEAYYMLMGYINNDL